jgi:hypothetical protein
MTFSATLLLTIAMGDQSQDAPKHPIFPTKREVGAALDDASMMMSSSGIRFSQAKVRNLACIISSPPKLNLPAAGSSAPSETQTLAVAECSFQVRFVRAKSLKKQRRLMIPSSGPKTVQHARKAAKWRDEKQLFILEPDRFCAMVSRTPPPNSNCMKSPWRWRVSYSPQAGVFPFRIP